jgi:predicted nucleotidyltransferase
MDMTEKMGATIPQSLSQEIWHIVQQFASDTKQLLQEELMAEYLFGSYATNTQTPASDIDILVIVKHFSPELQRKISGLASDWGVKNHV